MTEPKEPEAMTEKQRRILDAAMEVFAERGYAGASTSEIAKRAGVAEGTIFRHYKTKKDLLIGIVAPVFFRFAAPQLLEEVYGIFRAEYDTFEDFVRALYQNRFAFTRKHQRVLRIAFQEMPFHPEVRALIEETVTTRIYAEAKPLIERFQAKGEVIDADAASVLRVLVTLMMGFAITRFLIAPDRKWEDEKELELTILVAVQGLRPR